jgi:hypothetical protein
MKKTFSPTSRRRFLGGLALAAGTAPSLLLADKPPKRPQPRLKVAVVTGGHPYDVPNFHRLFSALPGIEPYIQHMDDFAGSPEAVRDAYDAVLFYTMLMDGPTDEKQPWYAGRPRTALEHLGRKPQGIFMLHHAILGYPRWPVWSDIVGIRDRQFKFFIGEKFHVDIASPAHTITDGMKPWDMIGETYTMVEPAEGSQILLTVEHPKSMKNIAWTRQYKKSRVVCFQAGHDNQTWENPSFREVLCRGLLWCGGRLG